MTFQHFGSGTYHGADNFFSRYYILNPIWFRTEYERLIKKPKHVYRDKFCRWSTPFDIIANLITEEQRKRHASCGMGIWNTIQRCDHMPICMFDEFLAMEFPEKYLLQVKEYYEKQIDFNNVSKVWKGTWNEPQLIQNYITDCRFMAEHTEIAELKSLEYDELIFENGQGLLLTDTRKDTFDTTPSDTGITYGRWLAQEAGIENITAHYVTRPYLTRHGDGEMLDFNKRSDISKDIQRDRTNQFNKHQGEFRYGRLDIPVLKKRVTENADNIPFVLEVTHCDEMDRVSDFKKEFGDNINTYDTPMI